MFNDQISATNTGANFRKVFTPPCSTCPAYTVQYKTLTGENFEEFGKLVEKIH